MSDGDIFIMCDGKNGIYIFVDLVGVQLFDGNWEFSLIFEMMICLGEYYGEIVCLLLMIICSIYLMLGFIDGGVFVMYDFRMFFIFFQLLGLFFSRLQQLGIQVSSVNYGCNGNFYMVVSYLQQLFVFDIGFKFEVGVVGLNFIMGNFQVKIGDCDQMGILEWRCQQWCVL